MYTYRLDNLGCANCAAKIEERVGALPGIDRARLDFTAKRLAVEGPDAADKEQIQRICTAVESDIVVREEKEIDETENEGEDRAAFQKEAMCLLGILLAAVANTLLVSGTLQTVLYEALLVIAGFPIFRQALRGIRTGEVFDENFLMSIAAIGAFYIGEYTEALGVLLFYRLGEALQDRAVDRATASVESLLKNDTTTAHLIADEIIEVDAATLQPGDTILLRAGDTLAADGKIRKGSGHISNQHMTGESVPVAVSEGDEVLAGAISLDGALEISVLRAAGESTMARIESMVSDARLNKGKTERWITRFSRIYTPVVVCIALAVALGGSLVFGDWNLWIYRACAFLIISCPCALVLSVPLTMFAGIGRASREGIFVKGSTALEAIAEADAVAFDKTGTLTDGKFSLARIDAISGDRDRILYLAATAEQYSNHPIARSILANAKAKGTPSDVKEVPGKGVLCTIENASVAVGNEALMALVGIEDLPPSSEETSVFVAEDKALLGRIAFTDTMKTGVAEAIRHLKRTLTTYIFSGDKPAIAEALGRELGIDETRGGLLPDEKIRALDAVLARGKKVVYVGDGINDAPVLARSDAGIAMGTGGSDMAIESADVVILGDDIGKLPFLFSLANRAKRMSYGNIAFALAVKLLVVVLSIAGIGNLWLAVFADVGVSLICVFIAMTLLAYKPSETSVV